MTKGEAKSLFLYYMGEATVNGQNKDDLDLSQTFNNLLNSAVVFVSSAFPTRIVVSVPKEWETPNDFVEILRTFGKSGEVVSYYRKGQKKFIFEEECDVEYSHLPEYISPFADESVVLDIGERAAQLVPLKIAIDAALGREEYSYKVPSLSEQYNTMANAVTEANAITLKRVFRV